MILRHSWPALAALALSLAPAAPALAAGSDPTGVGLAPAHPQPGGVAYFIEQARPGVTLHDELIVANAEASAANLLVSPVDGRTAPNTGAVYANRQDAVRGAGQWIRPGATNLKLAPHSRRTLAFTIEIPANATPGDHLAGVAFEDAASTSRRAGALTVRTVHRNVIGVLVRVAGPASTSMAITGADLTALPGFGSAAVRIDLLNDGRKLVKPHLSVHLSGPGGYSRAVDQQLDTVLPGDAVGYPQPWPQRLPAGSYQALLRLTAPGMAPVTYRAQLRLGTALPATTPGMAPHLPTARSTIQPTLALLAAAGTVAAAIGLVVLRRRAHQSRPQPRHARQRSSAPLRRTRRRKHDAGARTAPVGN